MKCYDCPVRCGADREKGVGACKAPEEFKIAHADLHFWEEPCISGKRGTGAVFFSGCNLNCVFCQNFKISGTGGGKVVSEEELTDIILALVERGAQTVSFVTPSHYITPLAEFLAVLKPKLDGIPIVYNSGGYDSVEGLKNLTVWWTFICPTTNTATLSWQKIRRARRLSLCCVRRRKRNDFTATEYRFRRGRGDTKGCYCPSFGTTRVH